MSDGSSATPSMPAKGFARPWVIVAGAIIGALTLIFLMGLVLLSVFGREVPCGSIYLVCAVLSLGAALAAAFIGGNASATGTIPLTGLRDSPIAVSLGGGVAVLFIMLLITIPLFNRADCGKRTSENTIDLIVALSQIDDQQARQRIWKIWCNCDPDAAVVTMLSGLRRPDSDSSGTQLASAGRQLVGARTQEEIQTTLDKYDLAACSGDFRFEVKDGLLVCSNGDPITYIQSPSQSERISTELIVLHSTSGSSLRGTIAAVTRRETSASYHFLISRTGAVIQLVSLKKAAFHVGNAQWKGLDRLNRRSIGISFVNAGQDSAVSSIPRDSAVAIKDASGGTTYWQNYTSAQVAAGVGIIKAIYAAYGRLPVVSHEDLVPDHRDPGPAFPMAELCKAVSCPAS